MSVHFFRRPRRYSLGEFGSASHPLHATAVAWAARVVTNGGASPSAATTLALSDFCYNLDSYSLTSKMLSVNCFVPDSLIAAITPLIPGAGNNPWTNHNFVLGDLTVNGLGGASSKYLDTGLIPSSIYSGYSSMGVTLYNSTGTNNSGEREFGSTSTAFNLNVTQLILSYTGTFTWDAPYDSNTGRISASNSNWVGYTSCNRTSATVNKCYQASSTVPHVQLGATNTDNVGAYTPSTASMFCFVFNNVGTPQDYTTKRFSFAAAHLGLLSTDSVNFYNSIQSLRHALGGGYV